MNNSHIFILGIIILGAALAVKVGLGEGLVAIAAGLVLMAIAGKKS